MSVDKKLKNMLYPMFSKVAYNGYPVGFCIPPDKKAEAENTWDLVMKPENSGILQYARVFCDCKPADWSGYQVVTVHSILPRGVFTCSLRDKPETACAKSLFLRFLRVCCCERSEQ